MRNETDVDGAGDPTVMTDAVLLSALDEAFSERRCLDARITALAGEVSSRSRPSLGQWWSEGGTTNLNNGVLLCTRHHHTIHTHGWGITIRENVPWLAPPPTIDPSRTPRRGGPLPEPIKRRWDPGPSSTPRTEARLSRSSRPQATPARGRPAEERP